MKHMNQIIIKFYMVYLLFCSFQSYINVKSSTYIEVLFASSKEALPVSLCVYALLLFLFTACSTGSLLMSFFIDRKVLKELYQSCIIALFKDESKKGRFDELIKIIQEDCVNFQDAVYLIAENMFLLINICFAFYAISTRIGFVVSLFSAGLVCILYAFTKYLENKLTTNQSLYLDSVKDFVDVSTTSMQQKPYLNSRTKESVFKQFNEKKKVNLDLLFSVQKMKANYDAFSGVSAVVFQILIFIFCLFFIQQGQIQTSSAFSIYLLSNTIFYQIQYFFNNFNLMKADQPSIQNIVALLMKPQSVQERNNTDFDEITLKHIHLDYDDRVIFDDTELSLKTNEKVLLTAPNGSGKSSLLKVMNGEIGSFESDVSIDLTLITSNAPMFAASFKDNVTLFGLYEAKEFPFVSQLIDKEDCTTCSGGEKQIIALCRALNKQDKFIVLDEFDAALDANIQNEIIRYLLGLEDIGVLMISHRLNEELMNQFNRHLTISNQKLEVISHE